MPIIAIGLLAGILILCSLSFLPGLYWVLLLPPILFLAVRYKKTRFLTITISGFLWALFQAHLVSEPQLPSSLERKDMLITGEVVSIPDVSAKRIRFDFVPDKLIESPEPLELPEKIRISWYYQKHPVRSGDHWQLMVRLKRPHGFMNPGGFDYERYLFQEKITATGYVRKDSRNKKLSESRFNLDRFRQNLAAKIESLMDGSEMTGLVQALVLGLRKKIEKEQWDLFLATGTNHLIAISGLHIGLVSGLGFWLGRRFWSHCEVCCLRFPAVKFAAITGWLLALVYAALAGFSIPTQRALIMVSVVILALLTQRSVKPVSTLSAALLLVLIWDSFAVLSAGFWLSFFAVMMIVWMLGNRQHLKAWQQWGFIQGGLALALLPMTVWFFHRVSVIAPLANFLIVPVVAFLVVPLVLIAAASSFFSDSFAASLFQLAAFILEKVVWLLDYLQALPSSNLYLAEPSWIAGLLALLAAIILFAPRGLFARGLSIVLFLPLLVSSSDPVAPGDFRVIFLDVGQGLSVVVQTAEHILLYDTGARFSKSFDSGSAVIVPYLQSQGIQSLDHVMISHADNDHRGGLEAVLDSIQVATISSSDTEALSELTEAEYCQDGDFWEWDGVMFEVLHPPIDWEGDRNNRACVLRVDNGAGSVLITSDIEKKAERALFETYGSDLQSTILLVPHHGSKTSSLPAFIDSVDPEQAVLSVGYLNRFGFPKSKVMNRYEQRDILIHNTVASGRLRFDISANGKISVDHYRENHSRFWHYKSKTGGW